MRSALYWDFTKRRMVVSYRRFGTTYWYHLQASGGPRRLHEGGSALHSWKWTYLRLGKRSGNKWLQWMKQEWFRKYLKATQKITKFKCHIRYTSSRFFLISRPQIFISDLSVREIKPTAYSGSMPKNTERHWHRISCRSGESPPPRTWCKTAVAWISRSGGGFLCEETKRKVRIFSYDVRTSQEHVFHHRRYPLWPCV